MIINKFNNCIEARGVTMANIDNFERQHIEI